MLCDSLHNTLYECRISQINRCFGRRALNAAFYLCTIHTLIKPQKATTIDAECHSLRMHVEQNI